MPSLHSHRFHKNKKKVLLRSKTLLSTLYRLHSKAKYSTLNRNKLKAYSSTLQTWPLAWRRPLRTDSEKSWNGSGQKEGKKHRKRLHEHNKQSTRAELCNRNGSRSQSNRSPTEQRHTPMNLTYRRGRVLPWCLHASCRPLHCLSSPHTLLQQPFSLGFLGRREEEELLEPGLFRCTSNWLGSVECTRCSSTSSSKVPLWCIYTETCISSRHEGYCLRPVSIVSSHNYQNC